MKFYEKHFPSNETKVISHKTIYTESIHGPWYPKYKYDIITFYIVKTNMYVKTQFRDNTLIILFYSENIDNLSFKIECGIIEGEFTYI